MRKFGLIGYPLKHSFSPGYFADKFEKEGITDAEYKLYELEDISEFSDLSREDMLGLNVTIPYKEKVVDYLQELSDEARQIGAVNTIKWENGRLKGYNTDCYGFEKSLTAFYGKLKPERALVLGSGGASKAVMYALQALGIDAQIVSRQSRYLNYSDLEASYFQGRTLIVNTTPLGTWPDINTAPNLPYELIRKEHFLYDLVYNPQKTLFLERGEKQGASVKNGYDMLKLQAEKSWEIWNR